MTNSLVSIIIPCYNSERWVAEAIESCLQQTYQPIEVIVVDDGSTDDSLSKIQSFGDRIKWVTGSNRGGNAARNKGFELSSGEYIMFLDADDKIAPENVALLVEALNGKQGYGAACEWRYLSRRGNQWQEFKPPHLPRHLDDIERELHGAHTPLGAWLHSRDIVAKIGGWDENLTAYQDVDFRLRCLLNGTEFIRIRGGRFFYRLHEQPSVSKTVSGAAVHSRFRVLQRTEELMLKQGIINSYRMALAKAYSDLASTAKQVDPEFSAECYQHMKRLAGGDLVVNTHTWQHHLARFLLGAERKEQLARTLAKYGVGRSIRKAYLTQRQNKH